MTSTTAGSPTCNCKNPDTCIHALTLKLGDKAYEYKQDDFFSSISIINKTKQPIPLTLSLSGKSCVSDNPECPKGIIYNPDSKQTLKTFTQGIVNYELDYVFADQNIITDTINFIEQHILNHKSPLDWLPQQHYILRVGQCYGDPFVSETINFINGARQIVNIAPHDRLWTLIYIYPNFKWKASVTIQAKQEVIEASDQELKKEQRQENKDTDKMSRNTRGWTKRNIFSIIDSLEIGGSLSYELNNNSPIELSSQLKRDFKQKAKQLTPLQETITWFDKITGKLSTNEGKGADIKLLKADMQFPKLVIEGSGELTENNNAHSVYMKGKVSVVFDPLIGIRITLDLLQAFAACYHFDQFTAIVREELTAREKSVNNGNNGAYVGLSFDLYLEGTIKTTVSCESDADNKLSWNLDDGNEIALEIGISINVRTGIKFYLVEGAFSVIGKGYAKGMVSLKSTDSCDNITAVFYHNGVKVEVGVSMVGGISDSNNQNQDGGRGKTKNTTSDTDRITKGIGGKYEWTIYPPLEESKSTCRYVLF